ncbi:MAG: hypothetical protein IIC32_08105, partial [Chloroflexi bacterium]|nr:hypothetical protein [Chloroflexota bacterium]
MLVVLLLGLLTTPVAAAAPTATFDPPNGGTFFGSSIFVRVTFSEAVSVTSATFGKLGDSPADVLATLSTPDGKSFVHPASGLQFGSQYVFSVNAENASSEPSGVLSTTFTVEDPAGPIQIPLYPGWNLVSLPAPPADSDIDAVLSEPTISQVLMQASPTTGPGPVTARPGFTELLSSVRADGVFSGDITSLGAEAFWLFTTAFVTLSVLLEPREPVTIASSMAIGPGWALVPVLTMDPRIAAGTTLPADDVFTNTSWSVAYGFDTALNAWEKLTPGTGATVKVGRGYWLWAPASTIMFAYAPAVTGSEPVSGTLAGNVFSVDLLAGWSLISFPRPPLVPD